MSELNGRAKTKENAWQLLGIFRRLRYYGRGYVTYAYNISGGAVVRWYRDSLAFYLKEAAKQRGCSVYDILNETCPAEPTGLIVLPFLQGMGGTPDVLTGARGTIYGLTMHTTPADIYRAILEGLTFEMQYNLEKLAKYNIHPTKLLSLIHI